ncbi:TPA: nucleotide sugar dehydrogenase [Stenotrophomonas maltophilia]|uniref:UDP-N-acetyl-D-galactosamine dehydrogenase n=1 Tax=Stenotrophomonas maltophilia TaxID=40324 RepID=A0AAP7GZ48_STEMA|nr:MULTISPECIES: nucleotide sugar dehydrogenase [Stenotrophomonas]MDH2022969.1 nucleotide sugar dehydrogenase [Stenotrophomonas sp. GD03680]OBU63424.1 UDP-N-acetyl-D-galactosamine dehydrogenase [Stenotrophomonas maltophilia]HDS1648994.1 nucleotide sugar dehydrogenase [Stenotrophomonas maltophilia]HEL3749125.1 nucleotide sugar dehydrogenase [Stenotrophomonas maltophilia]HEL4256969.1 nucleotide sugar dehydrogenase [Stenotrophomonas maltophilia]
MSVPVSAAEAPRFAVIGLGYVGLPLAVAFGREQRTLGFDIDPERIAELRAGQDHTLEVEAGELAAARQLEYSSDPARLDECNVYIVTVPTPIDAYEQPDLEPLRSATRLIASHLRAGDLVIYESTVYPGTTEEVCVPLLEQGSGLRFNEDFYCGYSPERVSPGDRQRRLADIRKITSGSTPEVASVVDGLYRRIIDAGTFPAPSMRVAEAAKVVENIQRDVNIALVNELALIFDRLGIDTQDVLDAAGSKWNFLPFRPGLVGGHCIGVDPYYLLHKSESVGYHPDLIHTARQVNNRVGEHVAMRVLAMLAERGRTAAQARVLVLGVTFKEDCPDLRNSRALELAQRLADAGAQVDVSDPWVGPAALADAGVRWLAEPKAGCYDAVVLAVAHASFKAMDEARIRGLLAPGGLVYDVKSAWPRSVVDDRL